jgi:uncharacterized ferritin-like protein (DUF455 family)
LPGGTRTHWKAPPFHGAHPLLTYQELAEHHQAPRLRGPFNLEARRAAGFDEAELRALNAAAAA